MYWNQRLPIERPQGAPYANIVINYSLGFGYHLNTFSLQSSIGPSHTLGDCLISQMVQKSP
jgi:hypothetical protein